MIPIALILVLVGVGLLAAGGVWLVHAIVGLREALAEFAELESKVDTLAEAFEDLIVGNVDKVEIRAMIRRAFYDKREKRP